MPDDSTYARARMRKALLAGGAVLGIGASATLAAWSDDSWVSSDFNTHPDVRNSVGLLTIQTALVPDAFEEQGNGTTGQLLQRSTETMLDSTKFTPPVKLAPGQTTYLPVYLRTSPDTESDAIVSVSQAQNGSTGDSVSQTPPSIWGAPDAPGFATYGARVQPLDDPANPPECAAEYFDESSPDATDLIGGTTGTPADDAAPTSAAGLVPMNAEAPTTQFTLAGEAKNTYMVCFRFHLDPRVTTDAPELNGAPFQPSWTFTGEAMDQ